MKQFFRHIISLILTLAVMLTPTAFAAESKSDIFSDITGGMLESFIATDRINDALIEDLVQYSDLSISLDGINVRVEGTMYDGINSYILFRLTPDGNQTIMMDYCTEPVDPVLFDDANEIYESTGKMMNFRELQAERGGSLKRVYLTVEMDLSKDEVFNFSETYYHDGSVIVRAATMQQVPDYNERVFTVRLEVSDCDDAQNNVDKVTEKLIVPVTTPLTTLKGGQICADGVGYNAVCYSSVLNGGGYITFDISGLESDAKERMADSFFSDEPLKLSSDKKRPTELWFMDGNGYYVYEAEQAALMIFSFRYVTGDEELSEIEYSNEYGQHVTIPLERVDDAD